MGDRPGIERCRGVSLAIQLIDSGQSVILPASRHEDVVMMKSRNDIAGNFGIFQSLRYRRNQTNRMKRRMNG